MIIPDKICIILAYVCRSLQSTAMLLQLRYVMRGSAEIIQRPPTEQPLVILSHHYLNLCRMVWD